jgi:hypothetical protein
MQMHLKTDDYKRADRSSEKHSKFVSKFLMQCFLVASRVGATLSAERLAMGWKTSVQFPVWDSYYIYEAEVFTTVTMKTIISLNVTSYNLVQIYCSFYVMYRRHLQGKLLLREGKQ